jgi:hypothetical protein
MGLFKAYLPSAPRIRQRVRRTLCVTGVPQPATRTCTSHIQPQTPTHP